MCKNCWLFGICEMCLWIFLPGTLYKLHCLSVYYLKNWCMLFSLFFSSKCALFKRGLHLASHQLPNRPLSLSAPLTQITMGVPIYKKKEYIQSCNNYGGTKLMSHIMKLWKKVTEYRMILNRFLPRSSSFVPLLQKYREWMDLCVIFMDLEKEYDKVLKDYMILERIVMWLKILVRETNEFLVAVGLYQGSALCSHLFALVIDELTRHIQENIPGFYVVCSWFCLVDETARVVNAKSESVVTLENSE